MQQTLQNREPIQKTCLVCGEIIRGETVTCKQCETPYHPECLKYNNDKCAIFGCGNKNIISTVRESARPIAIQKSQSLIDEIFQSKLDELRKQEIDKQQDIQRKREVEQNEFEELLQRAEKNLQKMAIDSVNVKAILDKFLPRKWLWVFTLWRYIGFVKVFRGSDCDGDPSYDYAYLYLNPAYELRMNFE